MFLSFLIILMVIMMPGVTNEQDLTPGFQKIMIHRVNSAKEWSRTSLYLYTTQKRTSQSVIETVTNTVIGLSSATSRLAIRNTMFNNWEKIFGVFFLIWATFDFRETFNLRHFWFWCETMKLSWAQYSLHCCPQIHK